MTQPTIKVENLSKMYCLGTIGTGTLTHDLKRYYYKVRGWEDPYMIIGEENKRDSKSKNDYVWALKDINFEVQPGEVLGIIGKNGAGKSTLLKILSKVTGPTTGRIDYDGRIGALLEVGTGFHPELTGLENIFLNGAILGMTKSEIKRKLDEIVDFSGVERYIDTPVKRFSSGMMVRLGFAVAAHLEPEILVVDEVLAVGDADFQRKAIGKMKDVSKNEGRTVLFVSHNMGSVRNLCRSGILLKDGKISASGNIDDVVEDYLRNEFINTQTDFVNINDSFRQFKTLKQLEFVSIERINDYRVAVDEPIQLKIVLRNNNKSAEARLIGMLNYEDETRVGLFITKNFSIPASSKEFAIQVSIYNHNLAFGKYYFDFNIGTGDFTTTITDYDVVYKTIFFSVEYMSTINREYINYWKRDWGRNCFHNVDVSVMRS